MGHISPKFPNKTKEVSGKDKAIIYHSMAPSTATVYIIKNNQTDLVSGEQHIQIGGWK